MNDLPKPNKSLGQHFLKDKSIIEKIVNDFPSTYDVILEVGPGPAILTKELHAHGIPLAVVERDERMLEYLKEYLEDENIIFQDALSLNEEELITELGWSDKDIWLVSNLPYNIASPLIVKFLQWPSVKKMTLMVQKEVGLKILGINSKGKEEMSSLHALCSNFFEVSELCQVAPGAFSPPPKVDSLVVSFKRIENPETPLDQFKKFEKFLRALFQFRRKQVYNVLKSQYDPEKLTEAFAHCNIERSLRAETFKRETIQLLYSKLTS